MFQVSHYTGNKKEDFILFNKQLQALMEDDNDEISCLANVAALFNSFLNKVNWVGFYIWKDQELVLGPFQGLPACNRIPYGKGVCGTAVTERKTQRVADVSQFPGHIACDVASQSEIVIPLIVDSEVYGVLDIDSPVINRFDEIHEVELQKSVQLVEQHLQNIL